MAYITPNSDVWLLKGVSLDSDYNHTVLQTSAAAQATSFETYRKYTLANYSYQRAGKNKIRVAKLADDLYDCNYMMFRNTAYGSKWFYAFIDSVDYINDNASEINYTIDDMQTWYFDYELGSCYVEREHTLTDAIGANLVPENFDPGELIPQQTWTMYYPTNFSASLVMYYCVVFYVPNERYINGYANNDYTDAPVSADSIGGVMNGVYAGYLWYPVEMKVATASERLATSGLINKLIHKLLDISANIVKIIQIPKYMWDTWITYGTSVITASNKLMARTNYNAKGSASYSAKNNKLYTFPYKSIIVSNNAGETATYRWEYFSSESGNQKQATFEIEATPIPTPEVMCYPKNYRRITNDYETGLILSDFPEPAWSEDSFAKWWAINREAFTLGLISNAVSALAATAGAVAGGGTGASQIGGAISSLSQSMGSLTQIKNTPDQLKGKMGSSNLRTIQARVGFKFYDMGLEYDKAKMIDDYFSMFGYACKQTKVPNVRTSGVTLRPHWNYVKTQDCVIHSATGKGLPADAEKNIASIYDKGITFWKYLSEVGNYSLDNSPS